MIRSIHLLKSLVIIAINHCVFYIPIFHKAIVTHTTMFYTHGFIYIIA